jgi:hypothetical protein
VKGYVGAKTLSTGVRDGTAERPSAAKAGGFGGRYGTAKQAAEKDAFVILNPRYLREQGYAVRKKTKGKSRFLTPFKNRTGFGMTCL